MIFLDCEATGNSASQICQLAYLIVADGIAGKNFFFSVRDVEYHAEQIHGFSKGRLKALSHGRVFADDAQEIIEDFQNADRLIGHNISADMRFLRLELDAHGLVFHGPETFCTMKFFTPIMNLPSSGKRPKPPKLRELARYYELSDEAIAAFTCDCFGDPASAHDARFDVCATYLCVKAAQDAGDLRGLLK